MTKKAKHRFTLTSRNETGDVLNTTEHHTHKSARHEAKRLLNTLRFHRFDLLDSVTGLRETLSLSAIS